MFGKHRIGSLVVALSMSVHGAALAQQALYTFYGDSSDDHLGLTVSGGGDVDNDGYDDLIAGAHRDDDNGSECGSVRVYSGKDGATLYTFYGDSAGDWLGYWVSEAGDVNSDGFEDIIAGAPYDDNTGADAGSARVYSGKDGSTLYTLNAAAAFDRFGWSVGGAGDVDNDGFADLIVGAVYDSFAGNNNGSARVFSGKDGSALFAFHGDSPQDQLGYSVDGAGDVNNDGFDDLIAGANRDDDFGVDSGSARVYSGQNGTTLYTLFGDSKGDWFGLSVSGAGDVNQDGRDDVIVGAPYDVTIDNITAGSAWVHSGIDGSLLHVFYGDSSQDTFGQPVSGAGDVNGDGFADLIVGMHQDDKNGKDSGASRIFSGKDGSMLFTCYGDAAYDRFGVAVSGAGDVNNDGFDDFISGAAWDDDNGPESGSARVHLGSACGSVTAYGSGCPGTGGFTPALTVDGCLVPGGGVRLLITGGLGGAYAFLFLGIQSAAIPAGGSCLLNLFPPIGPIPVATLLKAGPGVGHRTVEATLPMTTSPGTMMIQVFIADAGGIPGFSNTNGVQLTIL